MTFESTIQDVIPRTPSVRSFRIHLPGPVAFTAGQFMEVTILAGGRPETKYFTISSVPSEKGFIEFTKRITQSGFSRALEQIQPGAWVKISMPMGRFTLERGGKKIAFLSGGIGITPIYSMCCFAAGQGLDKDIVLLYGNHSQKDIPFQKEFEALQTALARLRVAHVLDDPGPGWTGLTGYITREMIVREIPDWEERVFFVCGPPGMVSALIRILREELGLPEERVVIENFTGY